MQDTQLHAYFKEQMAVCDAAAQALAAEDRGDEAVFAKIRRNVFEIFDTVLTVAISTQGARADAFFRTKLEEIPKNWHSALAKAEAHGDVERAHIESVKLSALDEIRNTFEALEGVDP